MASISSRKELLLTRQNDAPLRFEREQYLTHLVNQGTSSLYVRTVAARLVLVNRMLGIKELRTVSPVELDNAIQKWLEHIEAYQRKGVRPTTAYTFRNTAQNWLRFHGLAPATPKESHPFVHVLEEFVQSIESRLPSGDHLRGLLTTFFRWAAARHNHLSEITVRTVDDYLEQARARLKPRSLAAYCNALRVFFRYAATRGWSEPTIARSINGPPRSTFGATPTGPRWTEVRRMLLDPRIDKTPSELRCRAVLFLCSIYALRGVEVRNLKLTDFDWINERFIVRRAKRGPVQQFPIQYETGEAILRYLRLGRPRCDSPHLFVSLKAPFRPVSQNVLGELVRKRLQSLNIESTHYGTHALRHSCATQLVRRGSSLVDIAAFLGHRRPEPPQQNPEQPIRCPKPPLWMLSL